MKAPWILFACLALVLVLGCAKSEKARILQDPEILKVEENPSLEFPKRFVSTIDAAIKFLDRELLETKNVETRSLIEKRRKELEQFLENKRKQWLDFTQSIQNEDEVFYVHGGHFPNSHGSAIFEFFVIFNSDREVRRFWVRGGTDDFALGLTGAD